MAYFEDLNDNIVLILQKLLDDQELCKLLYYSEKNPLSQPNIADTKTLLMQNIYPLPKTPDAQTLQKSIVNAYFFGGKPYKNNSGFREIFLYFDIMCHLDIWMMNGLDGSAVIRPYFLSSKIDRIYNNAYIGDLSIGNIFFEGWTSKKFSDYFYGYQLCYRLSNNSNVACG